MQAIASATAVGADIHPIIAILPMITALAYITAAVRLLCFSRDGYRYRWGMSLLAAVLIGTLLCGALDIILNAAKVTLWQALLALLICILVLRSHGNVASLMRFTP